MYIRLLFWILLLQQLFSFHTSNLSKKEILKIESDTIFWSGQRKLIWDDFKGIPDDPNIFVLAETKTGIWCKNIPGKSIVPKYTVQSYFIKHLSWTKRKDDITLAHEQIHFDISELYARKIKKSFDSLNLKNVSDVIIYREVYKDVYKKCKSHQKQYDNEVFNDDIKQQLWIKKIACELAKYKRDE